MVIKTLDPDWIRIRIGIQPKMMDPDPYQLNTDPKHCLGSIGRFQCAYASSVLHVNADPDRTINAAPHGFGSGPDRDQVSYPDFAISPKK